MLNKKKTGRKNWTKKLEENGRGGGGGEEKKTECKSCTTIPLRSLNRCYLKGI